MPWARAPGTCSNAETGGSTCRGPWARRTRGAWSRSPSRSPSGACGTSCAGACTGSAAGRSARDCGSARTTCGPRPRRSSRTWACAAPRCSSPPAPRRCRGPCGRPSPTGGTWTSWPPCTAASSSPSTTSPPNHRPRGPRPSPPTCAASTAGASSPTLTPACRPAACPTAGRGPPAVPASWNCATPTARRRWPSWTPGTSRLPGNPGTPGCLPARGPDDAKRAGARTVYVRAPALFSRQRRTTIGGKGDPPLAHGGDAAPRFMVRSRAPGPAGLPGRHVEGLAHEDHVRVVHRVGVQREQALPAVQALRLGDLGQRVAGLDRVVLARVGGLDGGHVLAGRRGRLLGGSLLDRGCLLDRGLGAVLRGGLVGLLRGLVGLLRGLLRCLFLHGVAGSGDRSALAGQAQLGRACGPGAPALGGQDLFGDADLLGLAGVRRATRTAEGVPGALAELQATVVAVAGVDGPVATGLALGDGIPGAGGSGGGGSCPHAGCCTGDGQGGYAAGSADAGNLRKLLVLLLDHSSPGATPAL